MHITNIFVSYVMIRVKIPARIGLIPPVVKFILIWPGLDDFLKTVPNLKEKTLKMVIAFSNM